jgi:hypothetical protein
MAYMARKSPDLEVQVTLAKQVNQMKTLIGIGTFY